ncbi:MAG: DnaJ domain-containing protein [Gammaproteobacteria bacterium]|nr:DnaJ domain-containing protein [Gammaproteobacteria bacterium]
MRLDTKYAPSKTMLMIESLLFSIEQILQQHPNGISEYELIKALQSDPNQAIAGLTMQQPGQLFELHFIVFHSLYRLRDRWLADETACLQISAIKIINNAYAKSLQQGIAPADPLRDYYLDLDNLKKTSAEQVEQMISGFWRQFVSAPELQQALTIFELSENVDFKQIKAKYKQLAMQNHPDRGGSADRLAEINQAMDVLKRYFQPQK